MSEEQLKAFIAKVQADVSLQKRFNSATSDTEIISLANELGCSITLDDIAEQRKDLSDQELENISGGGWTGYNCLGQGCHSTKFSAGGAGCCR